MVHRAWASLVGGGLLVISGACSAVNPAFDGSDGAADTVPADSESPVTSTGEPEPTTGISTTGEGTGDSGVVDTGMVDTGPTTAETGEIPVCEPENPGRPLDIRIFDANQGTCADALINASLFELTRLPGTDHYVGRLCETGCDGECFSSPADRYLRIELPAEIGGAMAGATCVAFNAAVDANDECRVDHIAAWYDSSGDSKLPDLIGVSEDIDPQLIDSDILPGFEWSSLEPCGMACGNGSDVEPGIWAIKLHPDGDVFAHGEMGEAMLSFSLGDLNGRYMLHNLRSFVTPELCELQAAWLAIAL